MTITAKKQSATSSFMKLVDLSSRRKSSVVSLISHHVDHKPFSESPKHFNLDLGFTANVKRFLRMGNFICAAPRVKWDSEANKMVPLTKAENKIQYVSQYVVACGYLLKSLSMILKTWMESKSPDREPYEIAIFVLFSFLAAFVAPIALNFARNAPSASEAVNTYLKFGKFIQPKEGKDLRICGLTSIRLSLYFIALFNISIGYRKSFIIRLKMITDMWYYELFVISGCTYIMLGIFPCLPPFTGSLFPDCQTLSPIARIGCFLPEIVFNFYFPYIGFLVNGILAGCGILMLHEYLKIIARQSSVQDVYTGYRQLQLVIQRFNTTFAGTILPLAQSIIVLNVSVMTFTLTAFAKDIPLPILAFNTSGVVVSIVFEMIGVREAGLINTTAKKVLHGLKSHPSYVLSKRARKCVASLQDLRIMLGLSNYLEVGTCLLTLQFAFNISINLLLTYKS